MDEESMNMALMAANTPPDDIQQSLIGWIGECPYVDPDVQILTDLLGSDAPPGYAVAATGSTIVKRYLRRGNEWQNTYVLYARFIGKKNDQRQKNSRFLQNFMGWVQKRNENGQLFPIQNGIVSSIETSNGMLFDADENGDMTYQIQLKLNYYKEV